MVNKFFVCGVNHRTADISQREQLSLAQQQRDRLISLLLLSRLAQEAAVISTCNRTEIYGVCPESVPLESLLDLLETVSGAPSLDSSCFYFYRDERALEHLFRVASSLDSQIVGETHILGQMKACYQRSLQMKATGKWLNTFFQKSFQVAKKVRSETDIAQLPVSTGSCAATLAEKIIGELAEVRLLVVGTGRIGEGVAKHFSKRGVRLIFSNRTRDKAEIVADRMEGKVIDFARWQSLLGEVDAVVFATRAPDLLLSADQLREVMRARPHHPLLLLDLSVPRNVDPASRELESVFYFDLDAVQSLITANHAIRIREAKRAKKIIDRFTRLTWNKIAPRQGTERPIWEGLQAAKIPVDGSGTDRSL
ncbi:MAG: glutamyl-tRNA reductase [Acidobacteriota bacterium]